MNAAGTAKPGALGPDAIPTGPAAGSAAPPVLGGRRRLRRFMANRGAMVALGWLVVLLVSAVFAPLIAPYSPTTQDLAHVWAGPSVHHLLGTDDLGRDVLSRLIYGTQISMRVSVEVVALALAAALPVGLAAGYRGGWLDNVLMRIMDGGLSFPPLVLALAIAGVLGPGVNNAALALAVVFFPAFARLVRGQALAVKSETFIEASQSLGSRAVWIAVRRVLPNILSAVTVQVSLAMAGALLAESGLSFLGLGAQPPTASWGSMLQEAYNLGLRNHPWSLVVPGLAIALAVLSFNTVGDALSGTVAAPAARQKVRGRARRLRGLTLVTRPPASSAADSSAGSTPALLEVEGLCVDLDTEAGTVRAVDGVSFTVAEGEILGLVGESGSGKTLVSLSIMRLCPSPPARIVAGQIRFAGQDLLSLGMGGMRQVRGGQIAMVFQDPMSSLNPAIRIGDQIAEAVTLHCDVDRAAARARAIELLDKVGIADPAQRARSYPHQLSGGMRQRAMIAMALAGEPKLLIADEPTTALDVTIQAQVVDLLRKLQKEDGIGVIFVTHDLGLVADLCDRVAVMYAGQIVETASTEELFARPVHPYTEGLLASTPSADVVRPGGLATIRGRVPMLGAMPAGCRFHPRCAYATETCSATVPQLVTNGDRSNRCLRSSDLLLQGVE
jgi:peptide/nickel transport system permease protein